MHLEQNIALILLIKAGYVDSMNSIIDFKLSVRDASKPQLHQVLQRRFINSVESSCDRANEDNCRVPCHVCFDSRRPPRGEIKSLHSTSRWSFHVSLKMKLTLKLQSTVFNLCYHLCSKSRFYMTYSQLATLLSTLQRYHHTLPITSH